MTTIEIEATPAMLATEEKYALHRCEAIIRNGLQTYIEVGNALLEIRDQRLYRTTHQTFDAYCDERWKMSRARAYQLIGASEVAADLSTIVDIGETPESHLRPLAKLPPEQRAQAFQRADQLAGDQPRTAAHVRAAAAEITHPDLPIDFSIVQRRLAAHGVTLTSHTQGQHLAFTTRKDGMTGITTFDWSSVTDRLARMEGDAPDPAHAERLEEQIESDRIPEAGMLIGDNASSYKAKEIRDAGRIERARSLIGNHEYDAARTVLNAIEVSTYARDQLLEAVPAKGARTITLALMPDECAALLKEARVFESTGQTVRFPTLSQALVLLIQGIRGAQ